MNLLTQCRLFHHAITVDDRSKKSRCKNIKFKRAFQFLQTLLLQRVYGIDVLIRSSIRRTICKHQYDVFLGGSCNPTTWRCEQAIPYFKSHSISYYNPQVANWTPDLIDVERHAKEKAVLLFFVIDHKTRSLAAIAEACYLAACGRRIIVVMSRMPEDKYDTKFIQDKKSFNDTDNQDDYDNVCEARNLLCMLLQSINIPIFDNVKTALECSTFILENIKQIDINSNNIIDTNKSCMNYYSSSLSPFLHSIHITTGVHCRQTSICTKTQLSCTTNESDDDGYGSLESTNGTLSRSSSSISSDFCQHLSDHLYENNSSRIFSSRSIFKSMKLIFNFCTQPFRLIKTNLVPSLKPIKESVSFDSSPTYLFDLYIACGNNDECWLNTFALPILDEINVTYTKRQTNSENDQLDIICDIHIRRKTRLLYYLINNNERLSQLTSELAFLIGEHKYQIIVCLQSTINENSEKILTKNERQDLERSRKYLEDLAEKENILLYKSREQSWRHVLAFFLRD